MSRYIDADKFRKTLIKRFGCVPSLTDYSTMLSNDIHIDDAINLVPTADVVEVVRCKDCEYCHEYTKWNGKDFLACNRLTELCDGQVVEVVATDFAVVAKGERKMWRKT